MDVLREVLSHLHGGQIQLAVNKQSSIGWSPLIVASSKGHLEVVKVSIFVPILVFLKKRLSFCFSLEYFCSLTVSRKNSHLKKFREIELHYDS